MEAAPQHEGAGVVDVELELDRAHVHVGDLLRLDRAEHRAARGEGAMRRQRVDLVRIRARVRVRVRVDLALGLGLGLGLGLTSR